MRYINIQSLRDTAEELKWDTIKATHLDNIKGMSASDRKKYITSHNDWNLFQPKMLALSYNKCWYSEAPIGSSDFEVDHFRPKNCAKEKIDYEEFNSKSIIHKENGYWWLAYNWDNYRLSGKLINAIRVDRLGSDEEVKGKGAYFPLNTERSRIAEDEEDVSCEEPILLDPTNPFDVCLLSFNKGKPIPATTDDYEINRVKQSIFYYHLDLDQLNTARKIVWDDCVDQIEKAKKNIDSSKTTKEKLNTMIDCFEALRKLVDVEKRSYTSTAKACLMVYSQLNKYSWLENLVRTI